MENIAIDGMSAWADVAASDAGLSRLKGLPLETLDLEGCEKITDAGLEHLKGMPLQRLDLSGCDKITNAGLAAFRADHLACKIYR